MNLPFVIDNQGHKLADVLRALLDRSAGRPLDIATAYFALSGYRLLKDRLDHLGGFRLLIGAEPHDGADIGLARVSKDLATEPFSKATLRLVEDLIAFLRSDNVRVRLYGKGFLHAKAYLFHQDKVGLRNPDDRLLPFAAIVGSSNFTGPGLSGNKELNLVHRVFLPDEPAIDAEAMRRTDYLAGEQRRVPGLVEDGRAAEDERRLVKSEVGARAVLDLTRWYERQWADSADFKEELIALLDASKFGRKEYTPYQVYMKALYEYFKEELAEGVSGLGRSAVELADFQADSAARARRILSRYDGVLIADSVGLGKTWIGKRLLEDYAYHRRQKAVVICPASLRSMWTRELAGATIAAQVVGMEELGREGFDAGPHADADVILIDESHNFRNDASNRYQALDALIQSNGGKGRDGEPKKLILLSATPINNDLNDLAAQLRLFTQGRADYFREAGIGDLNAYFRQARRLRRGDTSPGVVLFNLLEEVMVRNTRPYIKAAYPDATIKGETVKFPDRKLHTVSYSLGAACAGMYDEIAAAVEGITLAPYQLEAYRKPSAILDEQAHQWEEGREVALVGIFKTRFLKRLESSIEAFRISLKRALTFEETYLEYLMDKRVVSSRDFRRAVRFLSRDDEDEPAGSLAEELDDVKEAREYIESLPTVDLNDFDLRRLTNDLKKDIERFLRRLLARTEAPAKIDGKLERLKALLSKQLKGRKVLLFTSFKDTARYLERQLAGDAGAAWRKTAGGPTIHRIDSSNAPGERGNLLARFAPVGTGEGVCPGVPIDILISTDVLSEGQNLQDCGAIINYDLTWNPIRLVQRNGRIDRLGSPHEEIGIHNLFPEDELESLLKLVERLQSRISTIDGLGLHDASILGEAVHPRTFNALRRLKGEDTSVLDEEEARAELAGPEALLKDLKAMLNQHTVDELEALPDGIHSGLRKEGFNGLFFYFQAPRSDGKGKRHFWRYIAATQEVAENRYEIARLIACPPEEPRVIGEQDVFALQDRVIDHILAAEKEAEARAAAPAAVDAIQQTVAETLKEAIRRRTVDREQAKACLTFLAQPMGKALHARLRGRHEEWAADKDDARLIAAVRALADEFGKEKAPPAAVKRLTREDLTLICFDHVSS